MHTEKLKTAAAALALFGVNALVTARLFTVDYTRQMGSIEASFISLARYIRNHYPDLSWFPLWYGGVPFRDAYPPLLHFVVAAVAGAARISPGLAYHAVTATVYALGPVTLFWAALRLGSTRTAAFLAAWLYSLVSPVGWLLPGLRNATGGWFGPRRLITLVRYGEGPHLTSLLILPLAIGLLHVALERRRPVHYVGASLAMAAVVLTNWIGGLALGLAVVCYLLAGLGGAPLPACARTAAIAGYAYAVALPWVVPSTIQNIWRTAPLVSGPFRSDAVQRWSVAGSAAGLLGIAWLLKRWGIEPRVRFGVLFLYATAVITLAAAYLNVQLVVQPHRYQLEVDLAMWLAVALAAGGLLSRLAGTTRGRALLGCVLAASAPLVMAQRRMAHDLEQAIDIGRTIEYRVSRWFDGHMPGQRVFAPGTIAFWMDAFSETPLLLGGVDQGIRNPMVMQVLGELYFGARGEAAVAWLKAFGCEAAVGGDPGSREVYHPLSNPAKLHGLPELWREGGDVIYAVPRRSRSLAHAVHAADLVAQTPSMSDPRALEPYLAALDDPSLPPANFRWRGTGAASISADLHPEHLLSIQVTWDEGWTAHVAGQPRRVWADKIGQMVVEPRCNGPCIVELRYDGGLEERAARWVSCVALGGGVVWVLLAAVRRRRRTP